MGKLTAYKKSRVDQRAFILAEFKKGLDNGKFLHEKLINSKKFRNDPYQASLKSIYLWLTRFKAGQFDVEDRPRCGRPVSSNDSRIFEVIERDPYVSITDLYCELDLPRNATKTTLARSGLMNVNVMWVPREISEEHRKLRIDHSLYMLQRNEKDPFLDRVIFEGEKYITYNKYKQHFKTKNPKKVLRPTESLVARSGLKPHRVVLHVWWTQRGGLIMSRLLGESERTKEVYLRELDDLRQSLEEKTCFLREDKPWILYHNRDTYLYDEVKDKVQAFGWEEMLHPKYCPDISPTDYHVFQKFQLAFNTTTFTQLEEVQEFVTKYFESKRSKFYQDALDVLTEKWHRVIETEGEYIATNEKM